MRRSLWMFVTSAALAATAGSAIAQPGNPDNPDNPDTPPAEPDKTPPTRPGHVWVPIDANGDGVIDYADDAAGRWEAIDAPPSDDDEPPSDDDDTMEPPPPEPAGPPPPPEPPIELPEIISTPTGRLVPAGIIYTKSSIDTSFGLASDLRVGLGDVAEFGLATTELVRAKSDRDATATRIFPYLTATFRMGVEEDRLARGMPGMVLGFRKSFERKQDGHATRIAELHLMGSKRLGKRAVIHAGAVFWDASIAAENAEDSEFTLHERGAKNQLRPLIGLELRPLEDALVLIDLTWVPEFCYGCAPTAPTARGGNHRIELRPVLSWGVRYEISSSVSLQSGVRLADIADANLLDAQIFGQLVFNSRKLRRIIDSVKDKK